MVGLGDLPGGTFLSNAFGVSADGSVVVGEGRSASGVEAFRWTQGGGMVGLGDLPGGSFSSIAQGVSADGAVVVGQGHSASGAEAFLWTQGGGMIGLGSLGGSTFTSDAKGVSANGLVVFGQSQSPSGLEAFRWTQGGGMVGLGDLAGGSFSSTALASNADGSVIVGSADAGYTNGSVDYTTAFVWTAANGMRAISDVLTENGVNMGGLHLDAGTGVSANGDVIVGAGVGSGPWIANINVGVVYLVDVSQSLSTIVGVNQSAQQTGAGHIDGLLDLASHYGSSHTQSSWSAWGGFSVDHYDVLRIDPEVVGGNVGLAFQASPSWRIGFGVQRSTREDNLTAFNSESDSEQWGAGVFASYEPGDAGLRVHAALAGNRIENDITRGYFNGATLVYSAGSQDGEAYGAGVKVGWAFPVNDALRLTPFASYEISRIALDGYAETGGPFPATYNDVKDTLEIARIGAEGEYHISDTVRGWLALAYAHRFSDQLPGISGQVAALSSPFAITGASVDADWGEASAGVEWRVGDALRLQAGLSAASSGDTDASYAGRLTAMFDF